MIEYIGLILSGINRLDTFINDFLYFSKQNKPNFSLKDINVQISNVTALFSKMAAQQNVKIINKMGKESLYVKIDPYQMEQVFVNILVNALQAMPEGGQLTIRGHQHGNKIELFFADNGPGITPDDLKNIFDPLFSTKEHGTGLGLPICRSIVNAHYGQISLDSVPGEGATVRVELPIIETVPE